MVESRLEIAQELGGTPINAAQAHPVESIAGYTGGIGADSSIEAVGLTATVDTAIHCVRGGGTVSVVGCPSEFTADFLYAHMWVESPTFRSRRCHVPEATRPRP